MLKATRPRNLRKQRDLLLDFAAATANGPQGEPSIESSIRHSYQAASGALQVIRQLVEDF